MALPSIFRNLLIGKAFTSEDGKIKMFGKMDWTMYPSKSLAVFLQDVGEKLGEDFLFDLGYENGIFNAKEMVSAMGLKPRGGWVTQTAMVKLLDFIGYGKMEFVISHSGKDGHHHFIMHVKDNPVVEYSVDVYGKESLVCTYFNGLFSGHGEVEFGVKNAHIRENKCIKNGNPFCEWETKW